MSSKVNDFDCIIQEYLTCQDFGHIYISLIHDPLTTVGGSVIVDGFYFEASIYVCPLLL